MIVTDRGYWDSTIETDLTESGVTTVVIPRTGKPSKARAAIEPDARFVEQIKWRTGSEGRISHLKRDWAWRRTRLRGHDVHAPGADTVCSPTTSSSSPDSDDDHTNPRKRIQQRHRAHKRAREHGVSTHRPHCTSNDVARTTKPAATTATQPLLQGQVANIAALATIPEKQSGVWEVRVFTGRTDGGRPTQVPQTIRGASATHNASLSSSKAGRAAPRPRGGR